MKRFATLLTTLALLASACSSAPEEVAVPDAAVDATTASTAAPVTTVATVTTTTVEVTTTTEAPTPTTAPQSEAAVGSELRRIQAAMAQTSEAPSGRFEGTITLAGAEGLDGEFAMTFGGAYDNLTGNTSFSIDMSSLADLMQAEVAETPEDEFGAAFAELFLGMFTKFEVRQIGDTVYMNNPFFVGLMGADTEWLAMPADEAGDFETGGFFEASPGDPADFLGAYDDTDAIVEEIGTEFVNGVETTHYRLTYDAEALAENATPEELAELEESGMLLGDQIPIDVWVTDEYLVRMFFDIDGTELDLPEEESFDRMTMSYDMYDWGLAVTIEAPPADQVTVVDESMGFDFSG